MKDRVKGKCPLCGTERTISKNRLTDKRPLMCLECKALILPEEYFLSEEKKIERREKELVKKQNQSIRSATTPTMRQLRNLRP